MKQRIISASDFKVHCLEYLEKAQSGNMEYIVTRRGKPIAKLGPITTKSDQSFQFGGMRGTGIIQGDILGPINVDWGL